MIKQKLFYICDHKKLIISESSSIDFHKSMIKFLMIFFTKIYNVYIKYTSLFHENMNIYLT